MLRLVRGFGRRNVEQAGRPLQAFSAARRDSRARASHHAHSLPILPLVFDTAPPNPALNTTPTAQGGGALQADVADQHSHQFDHLRTIRSSDMGKFRAVMVAGSRSSLLDLQPGRLLRMATSYLVEAHHEWQVGERGSCPKRVHSRMP
jgi:hypothetical protein